MELIWLIIALCTLCAFGLLIWLISNGCLPGFTVVGEVESKPRQAQFTPSVLRAVVSESMLRIWTSTDAVLQRLIRGTLLTVIPHQDTLTFEFFDEERLVAKVTVVETAGNPAFFRVWIDPKLVTLTQSEYALTEPGKMHGVLRQLVQNPAFKQPDKKAWVGPPAVTELYFDHSRSGD